MLEDGQKAPDFAVATDQNEQITLSSLQGKAVVLYFYPKDDTPGCTKESCGFRDLNADFAAAGATILGVSPDSIASHQKFRDKFNLNFPLLADADKEVVLLYGVWKEKNMYGRKFMGVERTTFVIDSKGVIRRIFQKVKVEQHPEAVLDAVRAL